MERSLHAGREFVAIPGPSVMPDRVLNAMHRAMPDIYSGELLEVTDEIFGSLPRLAGTDGDVFVAVANGHGAWEMALTNTLSRGDKVLVLSCGTFAAAWGEMARFLGVEAEVMHAPTGRANVPAELEARLVADVDHEIVAILTVQVDTATSVRNDIVALRAAIDAARHPAMFMVDCIASLGCEPYSMDAWGVDVTVAASQKGFMTPPGLGFVWASERALAAHQHANLRTSYWDWTQRLDHSVHYLRYCGTPPVSHLFGLREAIRMIEEEGLAERFDRHRVLGETVRAAVNAWGRPEGLSLTALAESERSNAVTTISAGDVDIVEMSTLCRERTGVVLGVGFGASYTTAFRIGHMGHVNVPMVLGVLGSIEATLLSMGVAIGASGVSAAVEYLAPALGEAPA